MPNYLAPVAKAFNTPPAPPSANMDTTLNAIERLGRMREQGYISDAEFVAQKQQLLGMPAAPGSIPQSQEREIP